MQATFSWTGATWYGMYFSEAVYERELARRDPGYYRLNWAQWGHIPMFVDVMDEYRLIGDGDFAAARAGLVAIRDAELADLNARLDAMSAVLEDVTPRIDAVR